MTTELPQPNVITHYNHCTYYEYTQYVVSVPIASPGDKDSLLHNINYVVADVLTGEKHPELGDALLLLVTFATKSDAEGFINSFGVADSA